MSVEWDGATNGLTALSAEEPLILPCVVKVDGETGGAWMLYDGQMGPTLGWLPNTEGIGLNLQALGAGRRDITQEFFDELTDDTKHAYVPISPGKP